MLIIFNAAAVSIYPSDDKKTKKMLFYNHRKSVRKLLHWWFVSY